MERENFEKRETFEMQSKISEWQVLLSVKARNKELLNMFSLVVNNRVDSRTKICTDFYFGMKKFHKT